MGVTDQIVPASWRTVASRWLRPLAWASLLANMLLVVTGGAVRLSGSGLGCPTWPRCHGSSFTPHGEANIHSAIEFTNRTLTFLLTVVAVATLLATWADFKERRDRGVLLLAVVMFLVIPAQAVIGGITVLTDLNPWLVALHLLCSMAIIGATVLFRWRLDHPATRTTSPGLLTGLAWATFAAAWVVLYLGTVVTGAGPHAGDAHAPRNGLDPLQVSQLHADSVFLFVGLTLGLLIAAYATRASGLARRAVLVLVVVEIAQSGIGFVQYFTHLPSVLVGFHMLGAALISAAVTWALVTVRES